MKKFGVVLAVLLLLLSLPLWAQQASSAPDFVEELHKLLESENWSPEEVRELIQQQVDWTQASFQDAKTVALCLAYAKDADEPVGPYEQAQIAQAIMAMSREMRALGFGENSILRTALNGTREALGELAELQKQVRNQEDSQTGDLIRQRIRQELQTAMHLEARHMVQNRVQEQKNSRPDDLLVPPGPQGPGGPNH
jgi:hypothetical protein